MFDVSVAREDEDTVRLETMIFFDNDLAPKDLNDLEIAVMTEVEAYTGFNAEVYIDPTCKEADIIVYKGWDPVSLGNDIQELVVAAGYARDRIEKEAKE